MSELNIDSAKNLDEAKKEFDEKKKVEEEDKQQLAEDKEKVELNPEVVKFNLTRAERTQELQMVLEFLYAKAGLRN